MERIKSTQPYYTTMPRTLSQVVDGQNLWPVFFLLFRGSSRIKIIIVCSLCLLLSLQAKFVIWQKILTIAIFQDYVKNVYYYISFWRLSTVREHFMTYRKSNIHQFLRGEYRYPVFLVGYFDTLIPLSWYIFMKSLQWKLKYV